MAEYIEREVAMKRIKTVADTIGFENPAVAIDCTVKVLERIPADDVAPVVRGRWMHHENGIAYCSNCEMDAVEDGTNFCPNCGADMREG